MSAETEERKEWDKEAIRSAMPWCEWLCKKFNIELKNGGSGRLIGRCPFHHEKTGSFCVWPAQLPGGHWHCFGCGEGGDAFALFAGLEKLDLTHDWGRIQETMAGIAGLVPGVKKKWKPSRKKKEAPPPVCSDDFVREVPPLRPLAWETIEVLARLRGLSVAAVEAAATAGVLRGVSLGVSERHGLCWGDLMWRERDRLRIGPVRCWVATDNMRVTAQARRLDGKPWTRWDGGEFKAWTIGTAKWPLCSRDIRDRKCVALVEGGPDMIAAYEFLLNSGRYGEVAVVGILGAGVRIREDALMFFRGKRVRIFPHFDKLDPKTGRRAGTLAAERWAIQLRQDGTDADIWPLDAPEVRAEQCDEGRETWDLNDAARSDGLLYHLALAGFSHETGFVEPEVTAPAPWPDWLNDV